MCGNDWFEHASLPSAPQLAALGRVLWLSPPEWPHPLQGRGIAVRAQAQAAVDAGGAREWIAFLDADDACCGRLYLLPDTDFLAWESLVAVLLRSEYDSGTMPLCRRLLARLHRGRWRAFALRMRATARATTNARADEWTLFTHPTSLSVLGLQVAHAIVRAEDAEPMLALPPAKTSAESPKPRSAHSFLSVR
jgi:hypothetical protein